MLSRRQDSRQRPQGTRPRSRSQYSRSRPRPDDSRSGPRLRPDSSRPRKNKDCKFQDRDQDQDRKVPTEIKHKVTLISKDIGNNSKISRMILF